MPIRCRNLNSPLSEFRLESDVGKLNQRRLSPRLHRPLEIEGKVIAVTDDPWGVADTLCHILVEAGIVAVRIMLDPSIVFKGEGRERRSCRYYSCQSRKR